MQKPESETAQSQHVRATAKFLQGFKSLSNPDFRTFWFGMLFNVAAMQVNIVSRSWLAYELSGSALILGVREYTAVSLGNVSPPEGAMPE